MEDESPDAPAPVAPESEIYTHAELQKDLRFNLAMASAQPPIITHVLIAINVAVFLWMAAHGFSFSNPSAESFLEWGADFGPYTTHGQWWRLVTAAFVHASFLHIAMNMYVLWSIGPFTERLFGRVAFTVLYLLAGIGGNLASLIWQPFTVAMGASGAIFGLFGGVAAVLVRHRNTVPRARIAAIGKSLAIFLGINLVFGLTQSDVDMAAHLGGLLSGFVLAFGLTGDLVPADPDWRQWRAVAVTLAASAVIALVAWRMPVVDDWQSDLKRLIPLDAKNESLYNEGVRKVQFHQMSAADFATLIDKQLLPPWNAERENLKRLKLGVKQRAIADELVQYMSLRAEAWTLMEQGIAKTDPVMVRQSFQKQAAAEGTLQKINQQFNAQNKSGTH